MNRLFDLLLCGSLALGAAPGALEAQGGSPPRDSQRVQVLEHSFGSVPSDTIEVNLERSRVYRAELAGPGALVFQAVRRGAPAAFVVPITEGGDGRPRRFEVYAARNGPQRIFVTGIPPGAAATLRLFSDESLARRIAERHDRAFAVGILVGGGVHSGYRLDPSGGADPRAGSELEGGLLLQSGDRLGTSIGLGRQSFPDAGFAVTWAFIEGRARLAGGRFLGGRFTDLGATVRYSWAMSAGPRNLDAALFSYGLFLTQHLASDGRRRGTSLVLSWQHARLGYAPETELLTTDRLTAGIAWIP